jgi:uncharacterized LabA/DUF88 family protein
MPDRIQRRTMVFIDGSAFRDTIQRHWHGHFRGRQELAQDYHALGRLLCVEDQMLVRVNYYTGRPVEVEELPAGPDGEFRFMMGGIELHHHEAHRARRVVENHRRLEEHIKRCAYTRLATGRVVARRRKHRYGPAFLWAAEVLRATGNATMSEPDAQLFQQATDSNRESKALRLRLVARLEELCAGNAIPTELLSRYTEYITMLRDESIFFQEKGVDTLLTVEMLEHCMRDTFDDAILFAADEDYVPLVEAVKRDGRRVIHAFLDVPNFGRRLREACDDWHVVTMDDLRATVLGAAEMRPERAEPV